ncbi:MAG: hypothetical protein U1D55_12440 [Phycisphaerae bacterium]
MRPVPVFGIPAFVVVALAPLTAALAQSPAELDKLHQELVATPLVSVEQGHAALDRLKQLGASLAALPAPGRAKALRIEILAALGVGDASRAVERAAELNVDNPDDADSLKVIIAAALAAGDAKLVDETLKRIAAKSPDLAKTLSRTALGLNRMGIAAPRVELAIPGGVNPATPGGVLVIDFWSLLKKPDPDYSAAMKALYACWKSDEHVRFIGVNADSATKTADARSFAKGAGYEWPQVFEEKATKAPITHEAFGVPGPPWLVVIDSQGFTRAIGQPTDAGIEYAIRAAAAEARGEFPPLGPCSRDGKRAEIAPRKRPADEKPMPAQPAGRGGDKAKPGPATPTSADLPNNDEAEAKLREARTFLRTGSKKHAKELFQEIVREYPGTRQAKDAQEYLDSLP